MKKLIGFFGNVAVIGLILGALTGCGGGGGGISGVGVATPTTGPVNASGTFVDGATVGLGYSSGANSGVTGANGAYTYEIGKNIKFFVGNVALGEGLAKAVMTPLHLVPDSTVATPQVVNIVRFLLSVGTLNADNSITIPQPITDAAKKVTAVNVTTLSDVQLEALVKAVRGNAATLVDVATASAHVTGCVLTAYAGEYKGSFSGVPGDPARTWTLTINPDGTVTGYGSNKILVGGVLENEKITGTISNATDFTGKAAGGCTLTGTLDVTTGILSGTWVNPSDPTQNGTFSGRV